jgi:tetratricopeptide (TPR) repeat protein
MSNPEAEKLIYSAGKLVREDQAGEAASLLHECLLRFPDAGKAYALLGHIYDRFFREPYKAEEYFKKAMILAPDFTETYLYYSEALLAQERYTEMTAMLNKALETTAAAKDHVYFLFGQMNEKQSKFEEAIEDYQKGIIYCMNSDELIRYQSAIQRCLTKQRMYNT